MQYQRSWSVIGAAFLTQGVSSGIFTYCFTLWIIPWAQEFDATRSTLLLVVTAATLLTGILSPFVGRLLDRYSIRAAMCAGCALSAAGFVLIAQATEAWQILLVYTLFAGSGVAVCGPMVGTIIAAKWFAAWTGLVTGIIVTGIGAGAAVLPPLVSFIIASDGWRRAAVWVAILYALLIPIIWQAVRAPRLSSQAASDASCSKPSEPTVDWSTSEILRDRGFQIIAVAIIPPTLAAYGVLQNLGPLCYDYGVPGAHLSAFISVIGISTVVGKMLFGALVDRFDPRYLYWVGSLALGTALAIVLLYASSFALMLVASSLFGVAAGSYLPLMAAVIAARFGTRAFGRAMGVLYPFFTFCAVGPFLAAWMRDVFGSYSLVLVLFIAGLLPVCLLMAAYPKRPKGIY